MGMQQSFIRASSTQIERERFRLSASQHLKPVEVVDAIVDFTSTLHVTVPIAENHVTDVSFTQTAQFTDETRTNAVLYPPVGEHIPYGGVAVFALNSESPGQTSLQFVDDSTVLEQHRARCLHRILRLKDLTLIAEGHIIERTSKAITLRAKGGGDVEVAWPSKHLVIETMPAPAYAADQHSYALLSTEHPMREHTDVRLLYSLPNALIAEVQYIINAQTDSGDCSLSTVFAVTNTSRSLNFDRITSLTIVDATHPIPDQQMAVRAMPTMYAVESAASSSSVLPYAQSIESPVKFTFTQQVSIAPNSDVQLLTGAPASVRNFLTYQTEELQAQRDYTIETALVAWFNNDDLLQAQLRSAPAKIIISHANGETSSSSFFWNRDEDARSILAHKDWLAKKVAVPSASQLRVETDEVQVLADEIVMHFRVNNHLDEDAVLAFPIFPSQAEGRCLSIENLEHLHAETSDTQPWLLSAAPQAYAVFTLPAGRRLNFLAHFSLRS